MLIAALLELKSRLMLPREDEELLELEPDVAADELLARMLEARRYREAAPTCPKLFAEAAATATAARRCRPRCDAPRSRRPSHVYEPDPPGRGPWRPAGVPAARRHQPHPAHASRSSAGSRCSAAAPRRGRFDFDEAVRGADR